VLRRAGYNTEIKPEYCECIPMLIWRASSDCFDTCFSTNMLDKVLNEVQRIIDPLGGDIPMGADLFDVSLIQDPDDWQDELFDPDFGRGAKLRVHH
jgi:hypothetical protein